MIIEAVAEVPMNEAERCPELRQAGEELYGGWRIVAVDHYGMSFTRHAVSVKAQLRTPLDDHPFQVLADTPTPPLLFSGEWEIRIAKEHSDPEVARDG